MASQGSKPTQNLIASKPIALIAAVLAAAIIGWSLFWFVASRRADMVFAAWIEREAAAGRTWICPGRRIAGYPLDIEISCANPLFQGEILGRKFTGSLRGIRASTPLLRNEALIAELEPPLVAKTSDGAVDVALQWTSLGLELIGQQDQVSRASLIGEQLTVQGTLGEIEGLSGSVYNFLAYVVSPPGRHDFSYDFRLAVNDAVFPELESRFGLKPPTSATFGGAITQTNIAGAARLEDRIEQWRAGGGKIDLKTLQVTSGTSVLDAHGDLDLDAEHRVHGALVAAITGLEPVLQKLGVDPGLIAAGSLVTNVLGKGGHGERLPLPIAITDGWLSIGPIRSQIRFAPLY